MMKKIPIAVGMMVFGFFGIFIGYANSWGPVGTGGSIMAFAGFFWFCWLWDSVVSLLNKVKYYDRRVRRKERDQEEKDAYRDLHDRSVDNKLKALEKKAGQTWKGQIVHINRKEA